MFDVKFIAMASISGLGGSVYDVENKKPQDGHSMLPAGENILKGGRACQQYDQDFQTHGGFGGGGGGCTAGGGGGGYAGVRLLPIYIPRRG